MSRYFFLFPIGLVFGFGAGFLVAGANGVTFDGHDHAADYGAEDVSGAGDHAHASQDAVEVTPGAPRPSVALAVTADPVSGWNVHVTAENFRFAPELAGMANMPGSGHAHLYMNGKKIARLYGGWMHLEALPEGTNRLTVTLNANDHRPLAVNGAPISASIQVATE